MSNLNVTIEGIFQKIDGDAKLVTIKQCVIDEADDDAQHFMCEFSFGFDRRAVKYFPPLEEGDKVTLVAVVRESPGFKVVNIGKR